MPTERSGYALTHIYEAPLGGVYTAHLRSRKNKKESEIRYAYSYEVRDPAARRRRARTAAGAGGDGAEPSAIYDTLLIANTPRVADDRACRQRASVASRSSQMRRWVMSSYIETLARRADADPFRLASVARLQRDRPDRIGGTSDRRNPARPDRGHTPGGRGAIPASAAVARAAGSGSFKLAPLAHRKPKLLVPVSALFCERACTRYRWQ